MAKPKAVLQSKPSSVYCSKRLPTRGTANTDRSCVDESQALRELLELISPRTKGSTNASVSATCCNADYRHSRYLAPTRTAIDAMIADKMKMETFIMI